MKWYVIIYIYIYYRTQECMFGVFKGDCGGEAEPKVGRAMNILGESTAPMPHKA